MKNRKLEDLKVGDWVYHVIDGWEKVSKKHPGRIETQKRVYFNGRAHDSDKNPTIYTYNPFDELDYPCEFNRGEIVAVRDMETDPWVFKRFYHYGYGWAEPFICSTTGKLNAKGWKYIRKLTPEERGEE